MPGSPAKPLTLIVATTPSSGIGLRNALPWPPLRGEMAHFKRATTRGGRNAVLMGRRTWESIPAKFRPLAGRLNVVVTSSALAEGEAPEGPRTAGSLKEAVRVALGEGVQEAFVIGGAGMYGAALGMEGCRRVLLTRIQSEYECDVRFPLDMEGEEARALGWRRGDVTEWLEEGTGAVREEKGVEYEFRLYER